MISSLMACRILRSAEDDLRRVMQSLITAEPKELERSQRLLENLVGALSEISASARREQSVPLREGVLRLRATLGRAESLSMIALSSLDRQVSRAGLYPADAGGTLRLEA